MHLQLIDNMRWNCFLEYVYLFYIHIIPVDVVDRLILQLF